MVVIGKTILLKFIHVHPQSAGPLNRWYELTVYSDWKDFASMKKAFNHVDSAGNDRYIFNIKGNDLRLVIMIHFDILTVYIRFLGTHQEYDKINCSTI